MAAAHLERCFHALLTALLLCVAPAAAQPRVLDDGGDPARWSVINAEGVTSRLTLDRGDGGADNGALRFDYDFTRGSGYCIIRREVNLALPEHYRFALTLRGEGPPNSLEFKLLDPTGDNVWWVNQRAIEFPQDWTTQKLRDRQFTFAWGPSGGKRHEQVKWIEIAIAATSGGKGTLWLDELTFEELPKPTPYTGIPKATVSQGTLGSDTDLDNLNWTFGADSKGGELTIDFGQSREFGGIILRFEQHAHWIGRPFSFEVFADRNPDESSKRPLYTTTAAIGGMLHVRLPDSDARIVRVKLTSRLNYFMDRPLPRLVGVGVLPLEAGSSMNTFMKTVALAAEPGAYPRHMLGQATYFTVVGVGGDTREALMDELGAVEVDRLGFSLEPFLSVRAANVDDGYESGPLSWANATTTQSLAEGYLPIPTVRRVWEDQWPMLEITAFAAGRPGESVLNVGYTVTNTQDWALDTRLNVAVRPFQVNPPYQNLNIEGGVSPITRIERTETGLLINGVRPVVGMSPPTSVAITGFDQGEVGERIMRWENLRNADIGTAIDDPARLASGAIIYDVQLPARGKRTFWVAVPFHPSTAGATAPRALRPAADLQSAEEGWREGLASTIELWRGQLDRAGLRLPNVGNAPRLWDIARSTLAYILINRDGPAIQPGSRCYERTWIRDGSLTSAAMLGFDHAAEVREFLEWFAPFQYDNGKVPCCADSRGPDPVPEHDSHGQFIYAIAEYHRFTGDTAFVESMWDRIVAAVKYIEFLRGQRMTDEYRTDPAKRPYFGVLPESISHEGYSAKPMHSYWDSLFALRGLNDAAFLARVLGKAEDATEYQALADDFRTTLYASMRSAMEAKGIDYIPGCVELGDFDATSTTIGVWPVGELGQLPEPQLTNTFEKYWTYFQDRSTGAAATTWDGYTPYELRVIGTFIRLGQRERAHAALDWFLTHQRPRGWNHWAEVVWRDRNKTGYVGDMPHTWVGSDFLNSFRSFFVYERSRDDALVLLAGVPREWLLARDGLAVLKWPTPYGALSYGSSAVGNTVTIQIPAGALRIPEGGIVVQPPDHREITKVLVNGQAATIGPDGELVLRSLPASLELAYIPRP